MLISFLLSCYVDCATVLCLPACFFSPLRCVFLFILFLFLLFLLKAHSPAFESSPHLSLHASWPNGSANMRTPQRKVLCCPPPATISSPLYQRILQFQALSFFYQQGNDVRKFAVEFSGAAEWLGYNECDLKDLFNSALDEPLSWWRMRGQDHLTFGEFVEFLPPSNEQVWLL